MGKNKKSKNKWYRNLRGKYRLVVLNDNTFEERFNFRLNRLNVIATLLGISIIFISLTFILVANTGIKQYIPGYPDIDQKKELYRLNRLADSLLEKIEENHKYFESFKAILNDEILGEEEDLPLANKSRYDTIENIKSTEDSLLRSEFEIQSLHNLFGNEVGQRFETSTSSIKSFNFFPPLQGIITSEINIAEKHFGIDIVAAHNEAIKATLDGTVIFDAWTMETGHVIVLQHDRNLISVYKHNSVLLKHEGDYVLAGEAIAISGESGEFSSGPHLHFELWYKGSPIRPQDYIIFN
jgi:murein DD-endopeptidase MepM/ murein hydrolase activator NlpD